MKMRVRELTMHDVDLPFSRTPVGSSDKGSLHIRLMQHRKSISPRATGVRQVRLTGVTEKYSGTELTRTWK